MRLTLWLLLRMAVSGIRWPVARARERSMMHRPLPEVRQKHRKWQQLFPTLPRAQCSEPLERAPSKQVLRTVETPCGTTAPFYDERAAPHTIIQSANGVDWYAMQQHAEAPEFEPGESALAYNQAQFQAFMPGYEQPVSSVDGAQRVDGHFEVRHENGSGTMFYDTAQFAPPRGDYQVYQDINGGQWYAIRGEAAVDRKPVYEGRKTGV